MTVYTIPAHAAFLPALSQWMTNTYPTPTSRQGMIVYLPTARAGNVLAHQLGQQGWSILPQCRTLAIDDHRAHLWGIHDNGLPTPHPTDECLALANAWLQHDPKSSGPYAIQKVTSFVSLYARLIRVDKTIGDVIRSVPESLASHWHQYANDLDFLNTNYHQWLTHNRQRPLAVATESWMNNLTHLHARMNVPVIVAGITDATPSALRVIQAIAQSPKGNVVLPATPLGTTMAQRLTDGPVSLEASPHNADCMRCEAPTYTHEAGVVRVAVQEALAAGKTPIGIVCVDRTLARFIAAELKANGLPPNDSAGTPLAETSVGRLLVLIAHVLSTPDAASLAAIGAHPLVAPCPEWPTAAPALEACLWRGISSTEGWHGWQKKWRSLTWDDSPRIRQLTDIAKPAWAVWESVISPHQPRLCSWRAWLDRMEDVLITLAPHWKESEHANTLVQFLAHERQSQSHVPYPADTMAEWLLNRLSEMTLPTHESVNGLYLWGAQEARLQTVSTLIIAGCTDDAWPPVTTDEWLSPIQLRILGLPDNTHRTTVAHDDWTLLPTAASRVLYTRSTTRNGQPVLPSRWWPQSDACVDAPDYLAWAEHTPPSTISTLSGAAFIPDDNIAPTTWSASMVETLRQCPYRALAERVMGLRPLDSFDDITDSRVVGILIHRWLESLYTPLHGFPLPLNNSDWTDVAPIASHLLTAIPPLLTDTPPFIQRAWRKRLENLAPILARHLSNEGHNGWRTDGVEQRLPARDIGHGVSVYAKADRIMSRTSEREVIDYKTGSIPAARHLLSGEKPQLPIEGWLLDDTTSASFWHVKGYGAKPFDVIRFTGPSWQSMLSRVEPGLNAMTTQFKTNQPWPAWPDGGMGATNKTGHCRFCTLANVCRFRDWKATS